MSYDPLIDETPEPSTTAAPGTRPRVRVVNVAPPPGLVEDPAEALPIAEADAPEVPAAGPTLADLRREQRAITAAIGHPPRAIRRKTPGSRPPLFALTPQPPK